MSNPPPKENTAPTPRVLSPTLPGVLPVRVRKEGLILTPFFPAFFYKPQLQRRKRRPCFQHQPQTITPAFLAPQSSAYKSPTVKRHKKTPLKIVA
jgi:hypothetical protein